MSTTATSESVQNKPMTTLQNGCAELGIDLSEAQIKQFGTYYQELVEWNQKFNLTAITEYEEVQAKHFLDCLVSLPIIAEELNESIPLTTTYRLLDVGTGAGFPGIPLKIASNALDVTLLDGTNKKIQFLEHVVAELGLTNVAVVKGRAEEIGRQEQHREQYDLVTARAVAPLNTLIEYLLPLTKMNGFTVVFKGSNAAQEFIAARKAIELLGGEVVRMAPVLVPSLNQERFIILIKKVRQTSDLYPRGQGLPRKSPLG